MSLGSSSLNFKRTPDQLVAYFQSYPSSFPNAKKWERVSLIASMIHVLGPSLIPFLKAIQKKQSKFFGEVIQVARCLNEIQGRLGNGQADYQENQLPWTKKAIQSYSKAGESSQIGFKNFRCVSAAALPFFQVMLLYPNYDLRQQHFETLATLQAKQIYQLKELLSNPAAEEDKKEVMTAAAIKVQKTATLQLPSYLFATGAFFAAPPTFEKVRIVFMIEALNAWAAHDANRQKRDWVVARLLPNLGQLPSVGTITPFPDRYQRHAEAPFQTFLAQMTVENVCDFLQPGVRALSDPRGFISGLLRMGLSDGASRNLVLEYVKKQGSEELDVVIEVGGMSGMELTPASARFLEDAFKHEPRRSDVAFLIRHSDHLRQMDFSKTERLSKFLLQSFQFYLRLTHSGQVPIHLYPVLLELVLHRAEKSRPWKGLDFSVGVLDQLEQAAPRFGERWQILQTIFRSANAERPYEDPSSWPLFHYLLLEDARHIECIGNLAIFFAKELHMPLTAKEVFCFAKLNPQYNSLRDEMAEVRREVKSWESMLQEGCRAVHKELQNEPTLLPFLKQLLLKQTICSADYIRGFVESAERIKQFLNLVAFYNLPRGERFFALMQRCISNPRLFDDLMILADHASVEAKLVTEVEFYGYFEVEVGRGDVRELHKGPARLLLQRWNRVYAFSNLQKLCLYRAIARLRAENRRAEIDEMGYVVQRLEEFCGFIPSKTFCFLFQYPSSGSAQLLEAIIQLREELNKVHLNSVALDLLQRREKLDRVRLDSVALSPDFYGDYQRLSNAFLQIAVTDVCPQSPVYEAIQSAVRTELRTLIFHAFFPPTQPLVEYLKVNSFNSEDGSVTFANKRAETYRGKCRPVLPGSDLHVYLDWQIVNDFPVLLVSFINFATQQAFSGSVQLDISVLDLEDKNQRTFLSFFLLSVARYVLEEELDPACRGGWKPIVDLRDCIDQFVGFKEFLELQRAKDEENLKRLGEDEKTEAERKKIRGRQAMIQPILQFAGALKVLNRELYVHKGPRFPFGMSSIEMASSGTISVVGDQLSLLPKFRLVHERYPEWYTSDLSREDLERIRETIQGGAKEVRINRPMKIFNEQGNTNERFILCSVESLTERRRKAAPAGAAPAGAAPAGAAELEEKNEFSAVYVTLLYHGLQFEDEDDELDDLRIEVPLEYPKEDLKDPKEFALRCQIHWLMLKAYLYRAIYVASEEAKRELRPMRGPDGALMLPPPGQAPSPSSSEEDEAEVVDLNFGHLPGPRAPKPPPESPKQI